MKQLFNDCNMGSESLIKDQPMQWLTTKQAAQYLGITEKALHNLNSLGRIPYFKFGRSNRYLRTALDKLIMTSPRGAKQNGN